MPNKPSPTNIEAVQKVLGEPVAAGLSDRAWKARTQLMAISVVAIALVGFGLRVDPDATVFGFRLEGLTDQLLRRGLGIWIGYLIVHFAWMAWEGFAEWRLRLTGTRVASVTVGVFASDDCDYPNDPRQSTLANWWRGEGERIGNLTELAVSLERRVLAETIIDAMFVNGPGWRLNSLRVGARTSSDYYAFGRVTPSFRQLLKEEMARRRTAGGRGYSDAQR